MSTFEILARAALVGIGGTLVLDLYVALLQRVWGIPGSNWAMVGRWIGHMPRGQFVQRKLGAAEKIPGERALGWFFHYLIGIGIGYGLLLVAFASPGWLKEPSLAAPVLVALVLLALPYFVMMPGMGMGIAASRAPRPAIARMKSVASHSVFGIGMYLAGLLLANVLP